MNRLLAAALEYEAMGFSVIPIKPGEKAPPLVSWEQYQNIKPTAEEIKSWWGKNPSANIGIVTGKLSNLAVIDLDKYAKDYDETISLEYFPDNLITPTVLTPRGGNHLYFIYPEQDITINARALPGIDLRGEGGYAVAPPSENSNGKKYSWLLDLRVTSLMRLPDAYINKIISTLYGNVTDSCDKGVTGVTLRDIWQDGTRDENLFHVAYCLIKTGNEEEYIRQTLRAIILSWGERDEEWINVKIKSALDRQDRKEKNVQAMVDEWIAVTSRDFSVTIMDKELGFVTSRDMVTARKALSRRKDITVEKVGSKDGWWRRIDREIEYMDFDEPEGVPHPILLPFDLHHLINIYEGNIILISGEFNAGKSLFALTTLIMNRNRIPIRYMSSEMKVPEIKARFKWFGIDKTVWMPDENCRYLPLKNNIVSALLPDGLNLIDYLEFPEGDFTRAGEYMKQIHDKLKKGVAVVCNQHKIGAKLPRAGDLVMEKPRLAVALKKIEENNDMVVGIAEILKAKSPKLGKMDGKKLRYEIRNNGSQFKTTIDWGFWKI